MTLQLLHAGMSMKTSLEEGTDGAIAAAEHQQSCGALDNLQLKLSSQSNYS